jgi:RNA polymerase sigma-B factor
LRRCINGALQHHLRDRVRLVRISRREHEKGTWPLGHTSLDVPAAGESFLLEQQIAAGIPIPCGTSTAARSAAPPAAATG